MKAIFQAFLRKFVIVLFDDILVYSMDWATHLHYLQLVLEVLQENHLLVKMQL